jgi:hypothetical protein
MRKDLAVPGRACGPCSACCTALGVNDLVPPKRDWETCRFVQAGGGCACYTDRPPTCRSYSCFWREGIGLDEHRPDIVGLILEPWKAPDGGTGIVAREVIPGAFRSRAGEELLAPIAERMAVLVVFPDGRRTCIGPIPRLRAITAAVDRAKAAGPLA